MITISTDMMRDIARERNNGASWAFIGRLYGMNPQTLKRAYLRKSTEVYGDPAAPAPRVISCTITPRAWLTAAHAGQV